MKLMELTPETQYQVQEPQAWTVGDLYRFPACLVLCISAGHTFACFITAEGMPLADIQRINRPKDAYFLHNTGLHYLYQSREQVISDYEAGFFTPYFDIL